MEFDINKIPSQKGRIGIVTGANVGLGFETAVGLAKRDIEVILACRNIEKAESAKKQILERVPGSDLVVMELDLNSLASVKSFADEFAKKFERLDLLINNAGIMMTPFAKTEDGFESQFGVNHLGHFLLTGLLLPLLEKPDRPRVVSLSSMAHRHGNIDFENLNSEKSYSRLGAYAQSKLACLMFAYELDRRLKNSGSRIISVAAHPGASNTELGRHLPSVVQTLAPLFSFATNSVESGAEPTLYAALGEDVKGGDYFGPTGFMEMKGKAGKVASTEASHDEEVAKRLWEVSEEAVRFSYLSG